MGADSGRSLITWNRTDRPSPAVLLKMIAELRGVVGRQSDRLREAEQGRLRAEASSREAWRVLKGLTGTGRRAGGSE